MQKLKSKTMTTLIALFLTLTMAIAAFPLVAVNGQLTVTLATHPIIGLTPNPAAVGKEVLIHIGITHSLSSVGVAWEGLTVTITRPDNTTETLGPFSTDPTGSVGTIYTPSMLGTYYFQTHFPQQVITATTRPGASSNSWPDTPNGTIMLASETEKLALIVVEETEVTNWPGTPVPTEYWTRPIDAQNWAWNEISGSTLAPLDRGREAAYILNAEAPESPHILWKRPFTSAGLAGGIERGPYGYQDGNAYEYQFENSVVIAGVLYYNKFQPGGGTRVDQEVVAVDLRTGKELWTRALIDPDGVSRRLSFGQSMVWSSYNFHGVFSYLWAKAGSTWHAFDPFSGSWVYSMKNVPSGTDPNRRGDMYGPSGEILRWNVNLNAGWMTLWNSTKVVSDDGSWLRSNTGRILDAAPGIMFNITIPKGLPGVTGEVILDDKVVGGYVGFPAGANPSTYFTQPAEKPKVYTWGFSLKPGQEGQLLFNNSRELPSVFDLGSGVRMGAGTTPTTPGIIISAEDNIFIGWVPELRQYYGFRLDTGELIWGPTEQQHFMDYFNIRNYIHEGKLISSYVSGTARAFDVKTGELLWTYTADDPYNEILYGNQSWPIRPTLFADGKIYFGHMLHSTIDPKPRGAPFVCLNMTTGEVVFRINGFSASHHGGNIAFGDGVIALADTYSQTIFAIGKGPSATSVSIQNDIITHGGSVLLKGMVTDISPGTEEYALRARFPNGVPAVADEDMGEWMLYLYKQFVRPADADGVEVTLSVIDSNGNYRDIGTTTSNADGFFTLSWQPDIEGLYTVYASFAGSESYWPSHAVTSFVVGNAVATPAPTAAPQASVSDMYFVPAVSGIIVAIIVGFVVLFLALRKRP